MKIAFVMPAYNEEKTIAQSIKDVRKNFRNAEIIVVDDGSKDRTGEIALKEGAVVLTHIVNRGLGASLETGITSAVQKNVDIIVTFDADLQHTSMDVKNLIEPIIKKEAHAVIGSRFLNSEHLKEMPFSKRIGNRFLTGLTNFLSGTSITDSQSGLRVISRKAAEEIKILCDRYEVSSEIIHELSGRGFKIKEIPIKAIYHEKEKGTNVMSGIHIFAGMLLKKIGFKR